MQCSNSAKVSNDESFEGQHGERSDRRYHRYSYYPREYYISEKKNKQISR